MMLAMVFGFEEEFQKMQIMAGMTQQSEIEEMLYFAMAGDRDVWDHCSVHCLEVCYVW